MRFNKQIILILPKILALFSILAGSFFLINKNSAETVENKSEKLQTSQQENATITGDDVIVCNRALGQENKDELSMLVNQKGPQTDPCLYMGCASLF